MARLVVDNSADELPSIDELMKKSQSTKATSNSRTETKPPALVGKGKLKRVLGRRDDNPLLRPLGGSVKVHEQKKGASVRRAKFRLAPKMEVLEFQQEDYVDVEVESRTVGRSRSWGGKEKERGIQATQQDEFSDVEARRKVLTQSRSKAGRFTKSKTQEFEIPGTQQKHLSDDEPKTDTKQKLKAKPKTEMVKSRQAYYELEIQEAQRDGEDLSDFKTHEPARSKKEMMRVVKSRKKEIPDSRIEEKAVKATVLKMKRLGKRIDIPVSDEKEEEPVPVTASRGGKVSTARKMRKEKTPKWETPVTQEDEARIVDQKFTRASRREITQHSDSEATTSYKLQSATKEKGGATTPSSRIPSDSEEDIFYSSTTEETDSIADFIIDDSEVEESPPPKPARRLVKGRRPEGGGSRKKELESLMKGLGLKGDDDDPFAEPVHKKQSRPVTALEKGLKRDTDSDPDFSESKPSSQDSIDLDDPFMLSFSPPGTKAKKIHKETPFATPPGSPVLKTIGLQSPKKVQRIPATPYALYIDDFWSQDVVNEWNDEYSPKKTIKAPPKLLFSKNNNHPEAPQFSLKQSPVKQNRAAKNAKKAFTDRKHLLAETFLSELDSVITSGQIGKLASLTGGVKIIWSKKLNTTAGRANWRRETMRSSTLVGPDGKAITTFRHHAAIELAEKVIDDEDRLLNVIAHEFCHLANFMVSNIKTNPHGKEFNAWALKVSRHFGDRGIEVTTKHSYTIDYKYIWSCDNCGLEYKRHSKSIDPARHRCGTCKANLIQVKPVPRKGTATVSEYHVFLKENMKTVMKENPKSPQKEILGLVGKRYQEFKKGREVGSKSESVDIQEVDVTSKEGSMEDDELDGVSRKLAFWT
ncbi:SprT-like family-domain-containing protein [Calycina marina]|uniref:SprT-like family-domain-containing protein n=1 Tax=Calycina marina TaxID=1763456 RepID=A0A9P7Z1V0_9HELO|nr:SprT-like family-domain-containing protein [Calycina marina]